jgi:hypothetical protein
MTRSADETSEPKGVAAFQNCLLFASYARGMFFAQLKVYVAELYT